MMKAHRLGALAAVLLIGSVTPAIAVPVTYSTSGVFESSRGATLNQGGVQIRFNPVTNVTVDPPPSTNAIFGGFELLAAPGRPGFDVSDFFTLTITQSTPGPGNQSISFTSVVDGVIFTNNSQAFVQFSTSPQSIIAGGFATTYRIVEGDEQNPGRLEILGNTGLVSTLNGEIGQTPTAVIPEPGTMALACAALPLLGLGYARRRRQMAQV